MVHAKPARVDFLSSIGFRHTGTEKSTDIFLRYRCFSSKKPSSFSQKRAISVQFSESADNGFHNGVDHAFDIEFRMRNQTKCHTVNKSHIHFHHHLDFFIGNFR